MHPYDDSGRTAPALICTLAAILATHFTAAPALADLAIETETARLLARGRFQVSAAFEYQNSSDGQEYAVPLALEYGLLDHLELMVEPVAFTSIQPKQGGSASGIGDTEATVTWLVLDEKPVFPAIGIAGEVKFPTARDILIGSQEFDYRVYAIATKRFGDVDVHFNIGYNVIGEPAGTKTKNPIDLALAAEWFVDPKFDLFAEVTYIGSSLRGGGAGESPTPGEGTDAGLTPEISGEETVGSVGVRYHLRPDFDVFGSFSYDNNDAMLLRTGVTWRF